MAIRFACPSCSKTLTVPDDRAGAKGACPACKAAVLVPPVAAPALSSRPGPPFTLDSWGQVDGVLGGLVEVVDRKFTGKEDAKVRAGLTGYAAAIPHHGVDDLGGRAKITAVREHRVYRVVLESLHEKRLVTRKEEPFGDGNEPDPQVTEDTIRVWDYHYPPAAEFGKGTKENVVGDSRGVRPCQACSGQKAVACEKCLGQSTIECPTCGGDGRKLCPRCHGDRILRVKVGTQQKARKCGWCRGGRNLDGSVCLTCNGTGMGYEDEDAYQAIPCSCGTGLIRCLTCEGSKRLRCPRCSGSGRVTCGGCQGRGRMLSYLCVVQSFEQNYRTSNVTGSGLKDMGLADKLQPSDYSPFLTLATTDIPARLTLTGGVEPLRAAIAKAFTAGLTPASTDNRLVRQRLVVGVASVLEVAYEVEGEAYTAWFVGRSLTAHVPDSPVTAALPAMARDAVRAWEKGDRKGATGMLREVMDMAAADEGCRRAYERIRDTIPTDLESKAKWVRWKPFFIAGGIAAAVFLVVAVVGIGYAVTKAKRGPAPPAAFDPRGGNAGTLAKEDAILLEFRSRSVMLPKGGATILRLAVTRLTAAGAADADVTVRLEAGRGLTVPAQVVVGRGQEEIEVEVRAGDEGGVFVVRAAVEGGNPILATECRVSVGP
ncbi:hypothetical protein J0H58_16505 [bacterium]|nr:hypothetical protein [bacterium]